MEAKYISRNAEFCSYGFVHLREGLEETHFRNDGVEHSLHVQQVVVAGRKCIETPYAVQQIPWNRRQQVVREVEMHNILCALENKKEKYCVKYRFKTLSDIFKIL